MKHEFILLFVSMLFLIVELAFVLFMLIPRKNEYIKIKEELLNAKGSVKENSSSYRFVKRLCDIVISLFSTIFFSPFLLFAAITLKLYKVQRPIIEIIDCIGYKKNTAKIYKFNTKDKYSKRSPIGLFLWKSGLDGLPIFYSVLKGDLTLIGLRKIPIDQQMDEQSDLALYNYEKPGFLSVGKLILIQNLTAHEVEVSYLKVRSILFDLKLLRYMVRKALLISVK